MATLSPLKTVEIPSCRDFSLHAVLKMGLEEWDPAARGLDEYHLKILLNYDGCVTPILRNAFTSPRNALLRRASSKTTTPPPKQRRRLDSSRPLKRQRGDGELELEVHAPTDTNTMQHLERECPSSLLTLRLVNDENEARCRALVASTQDGEGCDLVVLPSISFDPESIASITGINHYEERTLWYLWYLAQPATRVVFFSSLSISDSIINYQLGLMSVSIEDARKRLMMVSCHNSSKIPLTVKLAKQPRVLARVERFIRRDRAILHSFCTTSMEKALANRLNIPFAGCDPKYAFFGTKQGSRVAFRDALVPHCAGTYHDIQTVDEIAESIVLLQKTNTSLRRVIVKINDGVCGLGNAVYELPDMSQLGSDEERVALVAKELLTDKLCKDKSVSTQFYFSKCLSSGAIVEEFEKKEELRSPSCQVLIGPGGDVSILSTHEQVLDGLHYEGCIFPAREEYRLQLMEAGMKLGKALAAAGVRDRLAVDFIAWPVTQGSTGQVKWKIAAIEINLRHGGTTGPAMTCKLLCNAELDMITGYYVSKNDGKSKSYVATDALTHDSLKGLTPKDFLEIVDTTPQLQWDKKSRTGCVFYMIDCLAEHGKVGLTAVGNSSEEAQRTFEQCKAKLLDIVAGDHGTDLQLRGWGCE
eukprot:gb/GEZN01003624.1/.p1 GENE.gb/GEZN01003624.1/~~gb/GEZN01003624.1/.p1  ORF type:complete len:644 (+),score=74.04 gb/GEZN01003624.1/:101-2032(+)